MSDCLFEDEMDIEDVGEALVTGFLFNGNGYYDEEGIWHDPDVEEECSTEA